MVIVLVDRRKIDWLDMCGTKAVSMAEDRQWHVDVGETSGTSTYTPLVAIRCYCP